MTHYTDENGWMRETGTGRFIDTGMTSADQSGANVNEYDSYDAAKLKIAQYHATQNVFRPAAAPIPLGPPVKPAAVGRFLILLIAIVLVIAAGLELFGSIGTYMTWHDVGANTGATPAGQSTEGTDFFYRVPAFLHSNEILANQFGHEPVGPVQFWLNAEGQKRLPALCRSYDHCIQPETGKLLALLPYVKPGFEQDWLKQACHYSPGNIANYFVVRGTVKVVEQNGVKGCLITNYQDLIQQENDARESFGSDMKASLGRGTLMPIIGWAIALLVTLGLFGVAARGRK